MTVEPYECLGPDIDGCDPHDCPEYQELQGDSRMVPDTDVRRFVLERREDVSGISGTGTVADGVVWPDGKVALCWRGPHSSIAVWPDLDTAMEIHGHGGMTVPVFVD